MCWILASLLVIRVLIIGPMKWDHFSIIPFNVSYRFLSLALFLSGNLQKFNFYNAYFKFSCYSNCSSLFTIINYQIVQNVYELVNSKTNSQTKTVQREIEREREMLKYHVICKRKPVKCFRMNI